MKLLYQVLPGAEGSVRDGIKIAKSSHMLMMSTDFKTNSYDMINFISMDKVYPDNMISPSLWLNGSTFKGYNPVKYVLNWGFQKVFSLFYGVKLTDMTYGFRLAPTALMKSIAWEEVKHPFSLETCLKPIRLGVKIHEIPSIWVTRKEGES